MAEEVAPAGRQGQQQQGGGGAVMAIVQVIAAVILVSQFMGSKSQATPQETQHQLDEAFDDEEGFVARPTPQGVAAPPPSNPLAGLFGLDSSHQVHPSMVAFDDARRRALQSVPDGTPLQSLWGGGWTFDMFVFVSTAEDPELDFGQPDALSRGQASFVAKKQSAATPMQSYSLWDTLTTLASHGFLARAVSSITALWETRNGTASGEADESDTFVPQAPAWTGLTDAGAHARAPLLWRASGLRLQSGATSSGSLFTNISLPASVREHNRTLLAHVVLCLNHQHSSKSCLSDPRTSLRLPYPIVIHRPKKAQAQLRSLLEEHSFGEDSSNKPSEPKQQAAFGIGAAKASDSSEGRSGSDGGSGDGADGADGGDTVVPYWRPTLHVATVVDQPVFAAGKLPPHLPSVLQVVPSANGYKPVTVVNDWWLLSQRLVEINASVTEVPLEVSWEGVSLMYWSMMSQWVQQSEVQANMGLQRQGDAELIKNTILNTNPWLLGITFVVSTLHMVLDFLAFRADISFWRRAKSMEGLSVKSILVNVGIQIIILLYLFDNETSWMILISNVVGVAIEVWKLRKAIAVSIQWNGGWPTLDLSDKDDGYVRSKTKQYDDEAISNMGAGLFPLMLGYAAYSLFYSKHKSWHSWVLSSLVGFVYAFGFVLLIPQVYLNYRLKSVAAMDATKLAYRFCNTVIDDFFVMIVAMPTAARLAAFRDDVIFVVYLYQRWIYPVDKKRPNSFGISGEDEELAALRAAGVKRRCKRLKTDRHSHVPIPGPGTLEMST